MNLLDINDKAGEYPRSFYAIDAHDRPKLPAAEGEIKADVCIVGAGFTGLSAALHLARAGYDVVVLEAQRIGFGASGRNGGQVGTGQRRDQDELEKMVGYDRARALWDISYDAVGLVRALCAEMGEPFHSGIIHADHRARFVGESHAYVEKLQRDYGHKVIRALDLAEMRELVASDAYFGGSVDEFAGHIHPLNYVFGLAGLASKAGVRIFEQSRVTGVETAPGPRIRTEKANVRATFGIFACNGYIGNLVPKVAARVMPINNYIIATEPLGPQLQEALIAGNRAVADSKFVINYFRFSQDHRLLFGGTESYRYKFPSDIKAAVRKPMLEIFPQLADARIDYGWGGSLGITVNRMPHFARITDNVLSLSGYSGHGIAMATMGGKIAADLIAGQAGRFDAMADVPTHRFPGGAILRWPLLVLAMAWYSLRDRL